MTKDKKPGIPETQPLGKEGWKDQTKKFKTVIVTDKHFQGIVFMLGEAPLRKIGIQTQPIVISGMPAKVVVNAAFKQAPPHRIIFTKDGVKCYVKGTPSVLIN